MPNAEPYSVRRLSRTQSSMKANPAVWVSSYSRVIDLIDKLAVLLVNTEPTVIERDMSPL